MKDILIPLAIFINLCVIGCVISWCGGFNFDARNSDVSYVATVIICLSAVGASFFFHTK